MGCLYIVCCCNIYNQCFHSMKHLSVTNTHVLRLLEMLRETFIFSLTLFMHKSTLIPFLTKHSFRTLHQKLMLSTHKWLWSSKFPDMLERSCNFDINSVKILLHTLSSMEWVKTRYKSQPMKTYGISMFIIPYIS